MVLQKAFWLFLVALVWLVAALARNRYLLKYSSVKSKNHYRNVVIITFVLIILSLVIGWDLYISFAILFLGTIIVVILNYLSIKNLQ